MKATVPIRDPYDIQKLLSYFLEQRNYRNYALATLCMYTALRISDVLSLTWDDVYDFEGKRIRDSISLTEKKTKKPQSISLNHRIVTALKNYFNSDPTTPAPGVALILNKRTKLAISRIQAHRIISTAGKACGISYPVSCHSLRKTFGYHAWKQGISAVVIMAIYNHSSLAVTQRYLGITQDDKNEVYLSLDLDYTPSSVS